MSVPELLDACIRKKLTINKTTAYRELDFLVTQGIIREVQLEHDRKRYELVSGEHHHHIRCLTCGVVQDVHIPNELTKAANHIRKQTGFTVYDHSLEFVGYCNNCVQ